MDLPVMPPVAPMLAKLARELPAGDWRYEPKWDGFRCVAFRDGDEVELGSRNERPLTRYFPEVVEAVRARLPERCVVDGEIVVAGPGGLDFDALSQRIHPAASRIALLAERTPAAVIAFDLLALGGDDLRPAPFDERRAALEELVATSTSGVHLTPLTTERAVAADWFTRFEGAGLDGVVAKKPDQCYLEDQRVMVKVKHERTAEFVVGGFRWYRGEVGEAVGSLMLGLYDAGGDLRHVGVIGSFPAADRRRLVDELDPYRTDGPHPWAGWAGLVGETGLVGAAGAGLVGAAGAGLVGAAGAGLVGEGVVAGKAPRARGGSRWNAGRDMSFELLRPELVVEAAYEHLQGQRLRHTARFRRWRPDRRPDGCTYEQMDVAVPALLEEVFAARG
ncbi:MAG: ATP-dependent DNA ligase [Acidimicrobiales bacterium]